MSGMDDLGRTKQRVAWASLVLWSLLPWIVACDGSSPMQPANRAPAAAMSVTPAGQALVDVTILTLTARPATLAEIRWTTRGASAMAARPARRTSSTCTPRRAPTKCASR